MKLRKAISNVFISITTTSYFITAKSQNIVLESPRHNLNISAFAFKSVASFPGSTVFYSVSTWYDYKLPILNNRLSTGPHFNYSSDMSNTDYHIGFRSNYALINTRKMNLFVGTGLGYGKKNTLE